MQYYIRTFNIDLFDSPFVLILIFANITATTISNNVIVSFISSEKGLAGIYQIPLRHSRSIG